MFVDTTMAAALSVWGEKITLQRSPDVELDVVYTAPDSLRLFGGIQVDTIDAAAHVKTTDITPLNVQAGERFLVRGQPHHLLAQLEDDGAGTTLLLRRLLV